MARVGDGAPRNPLLDSQNDDVVSGYLYGLAQAAVVAANCRDERTERVVLGMIRDTREAKPSIVTHYTKLGL